MFKRIIAAVDGSSTSRRALRVAGHLAKEHQAALCIAPVVDFSALYLSEAPIDLNALEASVRQAGEQVLKDAAAIARTQSLQPEARLQ